MPRYQPLFSQSAYSSELEQLLALSRQAGIQPPASEKREPLLLRLLDLLGRPGYAGVNLARSLLGVTPEAPLEAITKGLKGETKARGSQLLQEIGVPEGPRAGPITTRGALGFLADIGLDPLTYFGGALGKTAIKGLKETTKIAGKLAPAPVREITETLGETFVPFYKSKRISPQLAEELPTLYARTREALPQAQKEIAALGEVPPEIGKVIERRIQPFPSEIKDLVQLAKGSKSYRDFLKAVGGGAREVAPQDALQEAGFKSYKKFFDVVNKIQKLPEPTKEELATASKLTGFIEKEITQPEKELGVLRSTLENYFPRRVARELSRSFAGGARVLDTRLGGFEKTRKFATQELGEAFDKKYLPAKEALTLRLTASKKARASAEFMNRLVRGEIKDINGNPLVVVAADAIADPSYAKFTAKGLEKLHKLAAPVEIVEDLEAYFKTFINDESTNELLRYYDKALGVWKATVTSIFPAFHVRNAMGNLFNMWLGGFKSPKDLAIAAKIQRGQGGEIAGRTFDEIRQLAEPLKRTTFFAEEPGRIAGTLGKPFEWGRRAGDVIEENAKLAFFINRLKKGDAPEKAIALTRKYLFDYANLTPFERNVMRRAVPFYTWLRNNIPLQLESLITQPQKYAALGKLQRTFGLGTSEEERKRLPAYAQETLGAILGTEGRTTKVLAGLGLPAEDLNRLFLGDPKRTVQRLLSNMSPALTIPLEKATGVSLFTGEAVQESSYYKYPDPIVKKLPQPVQKWLEVKEHARKDGTKYYSANPNRMYDFMQVATRFYSTIGKFTGLQPELELTPEALLNVLTGAKIYNIDTERAKERAERELQQKLEQRLIDAGIMRRFTKTYMPKY